MKQKAISKVKKKHSNALLLSLFNLLSDFDGQRSEEAEIILNELKLRTDPILPLHADVLGMPSFATCADLAHQIESLTEQQLAIASYAFQIFRSYEQTLRVDTTHVAPEQKIAYESQLERIRLLVRRTKLALAEAVGESNDT